jgi:hypothetical protein
MMSYISRPATLVWHWICWLGAIVLLVIAFPLVLFALAVWLLPDVLPGRGPSRSTSQAPSRRKLQIPLREGGDFFVLDTDGKKVPLTALEVSNAAKAWVEISCGAMVYEKTKLPD